jgi:hypothetical protein
MSFRDSLMFLVGTTFATLMPAQQNDPIRMKEDQSLLEKIEKTGPRQKLSTLQDVLKTSQERGDDPERYAGMVYSAFMALYANGNDDRDQAVSLEQKYALSALDRPDRIPTLMELRLVLRLRANGSSTEALNKDETRTKLNLLFHAWRRMEQDTKTDFDFADEPMTNVPPPRGTGEIVFSGIDPSYIKDSRLRGEYEAAIEKNRVKAAEYSRQVGLRNIKEPFIRHVEGFVTSALRIDAITESEVLSNLSLVRDDNARQRVTSKVVSLR